MRNRLFYQQFSVPLVSRSWCYFEADGYCLADARSFSRRQPEYRVTILLLSQFMYSAISGLSNNCP